MCVCVPPLMKRCPPSCTLRGILSMCLWFSGSFQGKIKHRGLTAPHLSPITHPFFCFFILPSPFLPPSLPLKPISQRPRTTEKSTTVANAHFKEERKGETVLMRRRRRRKKKKKKGGVLEKGFLFGLNTRCEKRVGGEEEESWK